MLMCAGDVLIGSPPLLDVPATTSSSSTPVGTLSPLSAVPHLNSDPSAIDSLYLDFVGDPATTWGGTSVPATPAYDTDGDPTTFSSTELQNIQEIWARVAEKYSPFNLNVTTVAPQALVQGVNDKVVIGGDGAWSSGQYGGLAYVGSFTDPDLPDWEYVFSDNVGAGDPHYTAEAVAHEAGHSFGLDHQSVYSGTTKTNEYNLGDANTAPIMGESYYAERGIWWDGQSSISSTTIQDDLSVISAADNGFGYRPEDHGQSIAAADTLSAAGTSVSATGVITSTGDHDYFSFSTGAGTVTLNANVAQFGPTLHAKMQLFDAQGNLVATAADASTLSQTISTSLAAGTYYVAIESFGSYGDIGQYSVSGTIVSSAPSVFVSGAASVNEGSPFTLNLAASHYGHTFTAWSVDWGDGSVDTIMGNPSTATHTYADGPNAYVIHATATDDTGTYAAADESVTVNNVAPTININGSSTATDGVAYSFTLGAVTDPGQDTVSQFIIHWGDGTSDTYTSGGVKTHVFSTMGNKTVTVDLADEDGAYPFAATMEITVSPTALDLGSIAGKKGLKVTPGGLLSTHGQQAWYKLTVPDSSRYTLSLSGQKDVLALDLMNSSGTTLITRSSKKTLGLSGSLSSGVYFFRVTLAGTKTAKYRMAITGKQNAATLHKVKLAPRLQPLWSLLL